MTEEKKKPTIDSEVIWERGAQQRKQLSDLGYTPEQIDNVSQLAPHKTRAISTYLDAYDNRKDHLIALLMKRNNIDRDIAEIVYKKIRETILLGKGAYGTEIPLTSASLPWNVKMFYQNALADNDDIDVGV